MLGVPGLMRAWRAGNVALANAPGCGVADDKVIYTYVPEIIRYYTGEDPILPNVPSYRCVDKDVARLRDRQHRQDGREAGQRVGRLRHVDRPEVDEGRTRKIRPADPRESAQLHGAADADRCRRAPTLVNNHAEPRHLDLRPFILSGAATYVTTGGLTRVAMRKGSTVVNSSQGGGSKDTWVVDVE